MIEIRKEIKLGNVFFFKKTDVHSVHGSWATQGRKLLDEVRDYEHNDWPST